MIRVVCVCDRSGIYYLYTLSYVYIQSVQKFDQKLQAELIVHDIYMSMLNPKSKIHCSSLRSYQKCKLRPKFKINTQNIPNNISILLLQYEACACHVRAKTSFSCCHFSGGDNWYRKAREGARDGPPRACSQCNSMWTCY